jgi:hypothetical protein
MGIVELLAIILVFISAGFAIVGGVVLSGDMIKRTSATYYNGSLFLRQYFLKQKALAVASILCLCSALIAQMFAGSGRVGLKVHGYTFLWFPAVVIVPFVALLYAIYRFTFGLWYFGNPEVEENLKRVRELTENIQNIEDSVPGRNAYVRDCRILISQWALMGWSLPRGFHPNQVTQEMGERIYEVQERRYHFYSRFRRQ